jgi:hypothetical protein
MRVMKLVPFQPGQLIVNLNVHHVPIVVYMHCYLLVMDY